MMSLKLASTLAIGVSLSLVLVSAQSKRTNGPAQTTWNFDRLDNIGGNPTRVEGNPKLIDTPVGRAVEFDGIDDIIFVDNHPLAGAEQWTFEAIFRPDGGEFAQRWFHLAERDSKTGLLAPIGYPKNRDMNQRFLFELRTRGGQWWLDAFVTGGGVNDYRSLLLQENLKHPVGRWYVVAQTYDGVTHRSYVNRTLQAELPLTAYKPMGPGGASIGARANRSDFFKGAVRQGRFTASALRPAQFLKVD